MNPFLYNCTINGKVLKEVTLDEAIKAYEVTENTDFKIERVTVNDRDSKHHMPPNKKLFGV